MPDSSRLAVPLRVCERCPIRHYENCPDCFGFGVYLGKHGAWVPIIAREAHDWDEQAPPFEPLPCPTCDSTYKGVPE